MSSGSIFGGMGIVVKFLINFNILFGVLAERRKKKMMDLAHGFDVTPSKLKAKRQNRLEKFAFFQVFACAGEGGVIL